MNYQIDVTRFARMVRNKRGSQGLRAVSAVLDEVSPSTLSRIENGKDPDLYTFLQLCGWLGTDPGEFIIAQGERLKRSPEGTPEALERIILADPHLEPATAAALAAIVRATYRELAAGSAASKAPG